MTASTVSRRPIPREDLARAILAKHGSRFLYRDHQLLKRGDFVGLSRSLRRSSRRTWWVMLVCGVFLVFVGTSHMVAGTGTPAGGLLNLVFGIVLVVQGAVQHQRVQATCELVEELLPDESDASPAGEKPAGRDFRVRTLEHELDESGGH